MRRTASEVIADLELRVSSLERQSAKNYTLVANYHTIYKPNPRNLPERDFQNKILFQGPKTMFIPQPVTMTNRHNQDKQLEVFVKTQVIQEIKKLQKEIEQVFYASGFDPTLDYRTFQNSGNKFEWVLVAQRSGGGEAVSIAYVRTTDNTYNFYVAPSIKINVVDTNGRDAKAVYFFNFLSSELGMRTVRIG